MTKTLELEKSNQACEILDELDLDAWLVWVRETSQMADPVLPIILSREVVWQSALIYSRDGTKTAIVGNFDADGVEQAGIFDEVIPYTEGIREQLVTTLTKIDPHEIAINFSKNDVAADGLTVGMHLLLKEYLEDTPFQDRLKSAEQVIGRLRGRKTDTELKRIREAVHITETIYKEAERFVRTGLSEMEIYEFFKQRMSHYGVGNAWDPEHNPAVDAGPNKEFGHSGPTNNKTKAGHLLHFDFGVKKNGYCSDIQRMFYFGIPSDIPDQIQDAFDTVYGAIQKASDHLRPGMKGYEVDAIARDYVKERGYDEYQHALGHQVGRIAHDGGTLLGPLWDRYGDSPKGEVEVGNVFTLELYVWTEDYGQLSLEEDVVVTEDGCEFLSSPQEELICIE
ncbi:MAG: aminopeptidase P family protein [Candidatus Thorarchaeota archaeon]|nr:aminopeptidase P family protein [Candidatus Thorarchaeota archaeon]